MLAGIGVGSGIGFITSLVTNLFGNQSQTNSEMQGILGQETNLLNEANLQLEQEQATPGLIGQRNAQEEMLNPPNQPFNAGGTFNPVAK